MREIDNTGAIWGDLFKDPPPLPKSDRPDIRILVTCISCGNDYWVYKSEKTCRVCKGGLYG